MLETYKILSIPLIFLSLLLSYYEVGDMISIEDQLYPLNVCYGEYQSDTLRLADFSSEFNEIANKLIFFRMTATW
jgi:hypothetical protein